MSPDTTKPLSTRLKMRDIAYIKPKGYENYLTLTELSRLLKKDTSWIKKLERDDRIPKAKRVQQGSLSVRLWSPKQVEEIKTIMKGMKRGRPKAS